MLYIYSLQTSRTMVSGKKRLIVIFVAFYISSLLRNQPISFIHFNTINRLEETQVNFNYQNKYLLPKYTNGTNKGQAMDYKPINSLLKTVRVLCVQKVPAEKAPNLV